MEAKSMKPKRKTAVTIAAMVREMHKRDLKVALAGQPTTRSEEVLQKEVIRLQKILKRHKDQAARQREYDIKYGPAGRFGSGSQQGG